MGILERRVSAPAFSSTDSSHPVLSPPASQPANARLRFVPGAHHRQRRDPSDDPVLGHLASVRAAKLLVGALRCRLGGRVECLRLHHAPIPPPRSRRAYPRPWDGLEERSKTVAGR